MKCLKVGSLPSKADPDEQEDYKVLFGVLRDFSLSHRAGVNALMFEEH